MQHYFRPIPEVDPARPPAAFALAGGWCWFDRVEVLTRAGPGKIVAANSLPPEVLARLTAPRAPIAGLDLNTAPQLMGILNVTPDSFSDGGRFVGQAAAVSHAEAMVAAGAMILDIGGESTRPGAKPVAPDVEISRVVPVITALRNAGMTTPISLDTRKAKVARAGLAAGADLINDVSAFSYDAGMSSVVSKAGTPLCLMHARGTPETMLAEARYDDVLLDVYDFLEEKLCQAERSGISRSRILVDPGIGFGKDLEHNLSLLNRISLFHALGCAVLLGASRKRFIGRIAGVDQAEARAPGSIAVALSVLSQGVQIIRAHDISETKQAMQLHMAVIKG